ncbi:hypothetical protein ACQ4LE_005823 [Meloidogyne hapla]
MNENLETSIDGSCSSCCLSQNIIESLKQRIEKLESEMEKKNLNMEIIKLKLEKQNTFLEQNFSVFNDYLKKNDLNENSTIIKQMQEKIQFLDEKTLKFQQMQLAINEEKNKQINEIKNFGLNNQSKEELEFLFNENKLLKEKNKKIEKKDLEKINENKKLTKQLEELNIEMTKIKEENQLTLTELSKYKEECQDLNLKYLNEKSQNEKLEQTNASLNVKVAELSSQYLLKKIANAKYRFINLPNKINLINTPITCCEKSCLNDTTISSGVCNYSNGYVRVNDGKIKYYFMENKEKNKYIELFAYNYFTKEKGYDSNSLFYIELKMIAEQTNQLSYATIGSYNARILISNYSESSVENHDKIRKHNFDKKFSWKDGDVFGWGFISRQNTVFFTKNGNKICSDLKYSHGCYPIIGLLSCSVEINYGDDLVGKPFCYDIFTHI